MPMPWDNCGSIVTDADGLATITFNHSYDHVPIVLLTPELSIGTDRVSVQIDSWIGPPYTGVFIATSDDAGKKEAGVKVHYLIIGKFSPNAV